MLEIHYYFTPLLDHLEDFDQNDWHLRPLITLQASHDLREAQNLPRTIENFNAINDRLQKLALDFVTVNLHGRKYGKHFMAKVQTHLTNETILAYDNQLRTAVLKEMNVTTADFITHRTFAQTELTTIMAEFQDHHFTRTPASTVLTEQELLQIGYAPHKQLQDYLSILTKTA